MKTYKYKLNMLEPGCKMVKAIGILGILAFLFHTMNLTLLCYLFSGLATVFAVILWVLLIIEGHQDKVLNEQAIEERRKHGED
jgi:hypothetical protein